MRKTTLVSLCALALVLTLSPLALAETPQETPNQSPVIEAPAELQTQLPADGLMAFIDPETGEILVLYGDTPMITPATLARMVEARHGPERPAVVVLVGYYIRTKVTDAPIFVAAQQEAAAVGIKRAVAAILPIQAIGRLGLGNQLREELVAAELHLRDCRHRQEPAKLLGGAGVLNLDVRGDDPVFLTKEDALTGLDDRYRRVRGHEASTGLRLRWRLQMNRKGETGRYSECKQSFGER